MVSSCSVHELYRLTKKKKRNRDFSRFAYGLFTGVLRLLWAYIRTIYIVVRIALLEYSKIHEKAYKFIVCEFGGFQNVLRDACVPAIPT